MKFLSHYFVFIFIITTMGIVSTNKDFEPNDKTWVWGTPMPENTALADNPLVAEWTGPYGGIPPFDIVKVQHFEPALEAGMEAQLDETERIASSTAAPTFENTIAALERSGQMMERVQRIYSIWSGNMSSPDFQSVQRKMAPKLSAFSDKIIQNEKLFKRIEAVYNSPEKSRLTPEQQRLTWLYYTNFVRS